MEKPGGEPAKKTKCETAWERKYPGVKQPQTYMRRWFEKDAGAAAWALDLGSGAGGAIDFRSETPAASVGVDIDLEALRKNDGLDYRVVASADALPFKDGTFDVVTSQYVLEHLSAPQTCFRELARIMRPGAAFLYMTTNCASYNGVLIRMIPGKLQAYIKRRFLKMQEEDIHPVYFRANTKSRLENLLTAAGFEKPEFVFIGGPFYFSFSYPLFRLAMALEGLTDGRLKSLKFYITGRAVRRRT